MSHANPPFARCRPPLPLLVTAILAFLALSVPPRTAGSEEIKIGGTGMALALARQIADMAEARSPGLRVEIYPSMGSGGALRALGDGVVGVAFSARPLNEGERAKGYREAVCMRTPLTLATSRHEIIGLRVIDLPALYAAENPTWPDGKPLKTILRSRAGSEIPFLSARVAGLAEAFEKAFARPGMVVGMTDQENAALATRIEGSLSIITLLQIRAEHLDLRPLPLDGAVPDARSVADGSYPFVMRLCMVLPATPTAGTRLMAELAQSEAGMALIRALGAEPDASMPFRQ